jgi:hypothetical protein
MQQHGPKDQSFAAIFAEGAHAAKLDLDWFETILTAHHELLLSFATETPDQVADVLKQRGSKVQKGADLAKLTVHQLLDEVLHHKMASQSCGQTSSLVHDVLAPDSYAKHKPEEGDAKKVIEAVIAADDASKKSGAHAYCRVEGAGHSYTVECFGGACRIYQSFFNAYTLAVDLGRNATHPIKELVADLEQALTPDGHHGGTKEANAARKKLFSCAPTAFHPGAHEVYKVTLFEQEAGAEKRLAARFAKYHQEWDAVLKEPAEAIMKAASKGMAHPKIGAKFDIVFKKDAPKNNAADFPLYGFDDFMPKSWSTAADGDYFVKLHDDHMMTATLSNVDQAAGTCVLTISADF